MEWDPTKVARELFMRVLAGYLPRYDFESCIDHWCDWLVLPEEQFNRIKKRALAERDKFLRKKEREKKFHEIKSTLLGVMAKYFMPIFVAIALFFLGYIIIPLERTRADIDHLQRENARLSREIEIIQQKQNYIAGSIERMQSDIDHLQQQSTQLARRADTLQHNQNNIAEQIPMMGNDIMYLARDNENLNKKADKLQEELRSILKPGVKQQSD